MVQSPSVGQSVKRSVMIDQFGMDPLRDKTYDLLTGDFTNHEVKTTEVANPQLIAKRYYNNHNLFYIILSFNGLVHQCEVRAGMILRIPRLDRTKKAETKTYEF